MRHGPDHPQLGTTTGQLERKQHKGKDLHGAPPELGSSSARTHRHLQAGFGSICESRGLSNLAPSRSKLFKLMGRVKRYEVELQQATSIYGG